MAGLTKSVRRQPGPLPEPGWGLFAALCAASHTEWECKRGTWGDRHVVDRRQLPRIFAVILASIAVGSR